MLNKRSFVMGAGGVMALPWLLASPQAATMAIPAGLPPPPPPPPLDDAAGLRHWQAYLHQRFELEDSAGQSCSMTLSALRPLGNSAACEQFVLSFTGEGDQPLSAGLYSLRHANKAPAVSLYLAETGDDGRPALRAEFNLLRQQRATA